MTARKSSRVKTRSNTKQTVDSNVVAMMAPQRASRMTDPPLVVDSIRITKRIQIILPIDTEGDAAITPAILMAGVPGGLTYWRECRFERIDVFSNSSPGEIDTISVVIAGSGSQGVGQWFDTGVPGAHRAHIGYRLGLLDRANWYNTAAGTNLGSVTATTRPGSVIVQAVVELQSNFIA